MKQESATLKGKIGVVTGGSKGIGRSIALSLARQGADLIVISRHLDEARLVAEEAEMLGVRALPVRVDVSDKHQVHDLMTSIVPEFGGVDIFVNNAGVTRRKHLLETTSEEIEEIIDINLKGAIYCLTGSARQMLLQNRGGNIVIVTSINALDPLPGQAVYSSTKAALEALVRCLAVDLASANIRVNSVAPGAISTDMNKHFTPEVLAKLESRIPLGRVGKPNDIGEVVSFLVSDSARYITGATIVVDGGFLLRT